MLSAIRKNQHSLTLFIVILTILSFIWLYNRTNLSQVGANDVATVYGRVIQQAEIERDAREYQLAIALGLTDFVRDLGGFAENEETAFSEFIFNTLVIQHEAPLLSVVPSEESIANVIRSLPPFQTKGSFDSSKYAQFMKEQLAPRGFTERHLEDVVKDMLSFQELHKIIVAPISISEAQVREAARIYQPVTAELLRLDRAAFLKEAKKSSPEEEKAFYEKNKAAFVTEEYRTVSYALLPLSAEQQKLEGKERVHALQKLADTVIALRKKTEEGLKAGKNFASLAKELGVTVVTTDSFNRQGESKNTLETKNTQGESKKNVSSKALKKGEKKAEVVAAPSKKILPPVLTASFKLSKEGDLSEVIQEGSSFYIVFLEKKVASQAIPFAEVQPKISALLQEQQADSLMRVAAEKLLEGIKKEMASGKKFMEAATLLHQKVEVLPNLDLHAKNKLTSDQELIFNATLALKEGGISDLKQAPWGEFIVSLDKRMPLSESDWNNHHAAIEQEFLAQEQKIIFSEWLMKAHADAKITMLQHRSKR